MLNDGRRLVYWDACVALSYINGDSERLPHLQGLLADDSVQLITSVLSITEVAWAKHEQDGKELSQEAEDAIKALWEVGSPIELAEFYELIAEDAREFMRKGIPLGWSLKPADAIHLATADRLGVSEFHTYDPKLAKFKEHTNTKFPINEPTAAQPTFGFTEAIPDNKEEGNEVDERVGDFEQPHALEVVEVDEDRGGENGAEVVEAASSDKAAMTIEDAGATSLGPPPEGSDAAGLAK